MEFNHSNSIGRERRTLSQISYCGWFVVQFTTSMATVCSQYKLVLLLQGQIHIIDGPNVLSVRDCELAVAIAHESGLCLRRIYQRINDRIRWAGIYPIYPCIARRGLPFVWNKPGIDLIDLVVFEHGCVLVEDARLRNHWSCSIRSGKTI